MKNIKSDVLYAVTSIITTTITTVGAVITTGLIVEGITGGVSSLIRTFKKKDKYLN